MLDNAKGGTLPDADEDEACCGRQNRHISKHRPLQLIGGQTQSQTGKGILCSPQDDTSSNDILDCYLDAV